MLMNSPKIHECFEAPKTQIVLTRSHREGAHCSCMECSIWTCSQGVTVCLLTQLTISGSCAWLQECSHCVHTLISLTFSHCVPLNLIDCKRGPPVDLQRLTSSQVSAALAGSPVCKVKSDGCLVLSYDLSSKFLDVSMSALQEASPYRLWISAGLVDDGPEPHLHRSLE